MFVTKSLHQHFVQMQAKMSVQLVTLADSVMHRLLRPVEASSSSPNGDQRCQQTAGPAVSVLHLDGENNPVYLLHISGTLADASSLALIDQVDSLRTQGMQTLWVDLSRVERMGLSGLYTVNCMALLLRGHILPDAEDGWNAVRCALEKNLAAGMQDHLALYNPSPTVEQYLRSNHVAEYVRIIHRQLPVC